MKHDLYSEPTHQLPEIDLKAIEYNLSLTPSERLMQHQTCLETVQELEKAHKKLYAKAQPTSKNSTKR